VSLLDNLSKEQRRKVMQSIRSTGTGIENAVSKALWRRGFRFRRNATLPGKPDISIKRRKIVIFVDSCFWHGCPIHGKIPKTNSEYWDEKIERNKKRNEYINNYYSSIGWKVVRIWEHSINADLEATIDEIAKILIIKD